jgi:hypothetical protein
MASFESILALAEGNALDLHGLQRFAQEQGFSLVQACDRIALHVAREYSEGTTGYVASDRIMNALFSAVTTEAFLSRTNCAVPPLVISVYQAFDEGEYVHPNDSPEDNQELKYTKPMIAAILESNSAAQPFHRGDVQHPASPDVGHGSCQTLGVMKGAFPSCQSMF